MLVAKSTKAPETASSSSPFLQSHLLCTQMGCIFTEVPIDFTEAKKDSGRASVPTKAEDLVLVMWLVLLEVRDAAGVKS